MTRPALRAPYFALVLGLGACSSVLGIDELHEGPPPDAGAPAAGGSAGSKPMGGTGGSSNPSGGSVSSSGAAAGPMDGGAPAEGGTGMNGGAPPISEGGMVGEAGAGGAADPDDPTVRGKVIDLWGQGVPGVVVQIGSADVTTNALGEFTIPDVAERYDVSLLVRPTNQVYGWYYVGLTRRNPTLQVYAGLTQRYGNVQLRPKNIVPSNLQNITFALGMPGGNWSTDGVKQNGVDTSAGWRGATTTTGTAHSLLWTMDDDDLPVSYNAYKAQSVALDEGGDPTLIAPDLTPVSGNLASGAVQGTITGHGTGNRENGVFVRFTSNASIQVVQEYSAPDTFSYLVPTLANASVTVAALEGDSYGPLGVAHADGLAAGNTNVKLAIPKPAEPLLPAPDAVGVKVGTKLKYTPSPDHTGGVVIYIENKDFYQSLFIVTAERETAIPEIAGGAFALTPDQGYRWYVETHGQFDSVDDMTGPDGFIDSFAASGDEPDGMKTSSGSYTLSYWNGFTAGSP